VLFATDVQRIAARMSGVSPHSGFLAVGCPVEQEAAV